MLIGGFCLIQFISDDSSRLSMKILNEFTYVWDIIRNHKHWDTKVRYTDIEIQRTPRGTYLLGPSWKNKAALNHQQW